MYLVAGGLEIGPQKEHRSHQHTTCLQGKTPDVDDTKLFEPQVYFLGDGGRGQHCRPSPYPGNMGRISSFCGRTRQDREAHDSLGKRKARQGATFPYGEGEERCRRAKGTAAPIIALSRRDRSCIVDVDASYKHLDCLFQHQQPDGEYHPISVYSRALLPAENNYFPTEIQPLGVVWAVTDLRPYLEGAELFVRCDH